MKFSGFLEVSPLGYGDTRAFSLTYAADAPLPTGSIVRVPLGRREGLGVVAGNAAKPAFATKPLQPTELPSLPPHLVELARWLHGYYMASPRAIWQTFLPAGFTKQRRQPKEPASSDFQLPRLTAPLTPEQAAAITAIEQAERGTFLLRGVTGAGKTRVYTELAAKVLAAGQSVILLVPEIALTPQLIASFKNVFGNIVLPYHSGLTEAQKHAAWLTAHTATQPRIIIGPRSALFLPLHRPGIVIIDEAHETSYKQEQSPRYQAEVVAAKLASLVGAKLILGSATPSLMQVMLAKVGRIQHLEMAERANKLALPKTTVVDLRDKSLRGGSSFFSRTLLDALETTLSEGRQSLLFMNRRGSASSLICADCGHVFLCPHCELPLTFHADLMQLICHICNFTQPPAAICPNCQSTALRYIGGGTKRVEAEVMRKFPQARVARLDRDSATPKRIQEIHQELHTGKIDILVGTQMIAKGLDLPNVDTVGIISADTMLHLPDFSAAERTFQLITQVSGRTGRGERPGRVILQTYTPDHPAITYAARHDFWGFTTSELPHRKALRYPPYIHLLKLSHSGRNAAATKERAEALAASLRKQKNIQVLGPAPAFRERERGNSYWQILLKAPRRSDLLLAAKSVPADWTVDIDPLNLL